MNSKTRSKKGWLAPAFFALIVLFGYPEVFGQGSAADLIIVNANVRTMASAQPRAEAIAVSGGKIFAVGSNKTILALAGTETKKIDAKGKLVLPGFNDAHVHFASIGNIFSSIKLTDLKSPKEFVERIAFFTSVLPKRRWILGSGWDNRAWLPNDPPTRDLIDKISPDNPVFIYNWDATAVFTNAAALKIAGIDDSTKNPADGSIVRDNEGKATGVLRGTAIQLVRRFVPADHMKNLPEIIETASNYAASLGITSVQDVHSDDLVDVLRGLENQGKLKTRVYECTTLADWKKLAASGVKAADGDAMVRSGCLKFFAEDETEDVAQLEKDIAGADKAGLQIAIHAIGSKPNEIVLTAFEKAIKSNGPRDRRFRVEHAQNVLPKDISRFANTNIIASLQPWLFYGESGLSSDSYNKMFSANIPIAFGSDASITEFSPLFGIYSAINGKNAFSVEQAVRAYTLGSAYAEFQEKIKGTIEVGKLADFVILSEDIFSIDRSKIRYAKVESTIVGGRVIFQSN
ncbi:MAG: amidohydrolase [Pyrinomonadaceae bacterium]